MSIVFALHVLAAVIWVGGMFFAYVALRPAAAQLLEAPARLSLWNETFRRFFVWVWLIVIGLPVSGYAMIQGIFGGMSRVPMHVHVMQAIGWVMIALYLHLYFAPYRRLRAAVAARDFAAAGKDLGQIRRIIGTNLLLGIATVLVATAGRYW